jgi:predicted dehydrogenase
MPQQLRAILVGCGAMSRVWLNAAMEIDGLHMVGLVDISEETAIQRAE